METIQAIALRRSCRKYKATPISDVQLDAILKAGNAAPVGGGMYATMSMTVVQNPALLDEINQAAAALLGKPGMRPTYDAPTLILVCSNNNGIANAACVVENMHLMAADLGLGSVYLAATARGVAQNSALMKKLLIPEGFVPLAALAVGYSADPLKERPLTREKIQTHILP